MRHNIVGAREIIGTVLNVTGSEISLSTLEPKHIAQLAVIYTGVQTMAGPNQLLPAIDSVIILYSLDCESNHGYFCKQPRASRSITF